MAGVDVGTAYLTVVPSAKGFAGKLQSELGGGMTKAGKDAGHKAASGFGSTFGSGIKASTLAGAAAIAGVVAGGIAFARDAIAEARESQKVGATTTAIIKATGGAAKVTAGQVGDLATAISNKTGMDDEMIQSGANMLLTFKNVRNEVGKGAQIFDRATTAAADLSAAGFGDVKGASVLLGKALNDPIKGITALGRSGVTFTEQQKKQIKTLVDSGKTLDAQKLILKEVEGQVGGTAAASATAGEKMATAFGNFKEGLGTSLLPVLDKVEGFVTKKLLPGIQGVIDILFKGDFTKGFADAFNISEDSGIVDFLFNVREGVQRFAEYIKTDVVPAIKNFVSEFQNGEGAGGRFRDILETVVSVAQNVAKWIGENSTVVGALVSAITAGIVAFKIITGVAKAYAAVQAILNVVLTANPIGLIIVAIAALAAGLIYAYKHSDKFRMICQTAFKAIGDAARFMWNVVIAPVIRFLIEGFSRVAEFYAALLLGMSKIPGFGWAKGAAEKLASVANKARDIKDQIKDIPEQKTVNVDIYARTRQSGRIELPNGQSVNVGMREHGGPVRAGQPYIVGERRPELFVPSSNGRIVPQVPTGGGGLSQADILRLAAAMGGVQLQTTVSAGSFDRQMGARL